MQHMRAQGPDIAPTLEARSVALIGASERPGSLGTVVLKNLKEAGFEGPVYAINPKYSTHDDEHCLASVRDITEPVDLAVIVTPAAAVPSVLEDCGAERTQAVQISGPGRDKRLPKNTTELSRLLGDVMIRTTRAKTGIRFPSRRVDTRNFRLTQAPLSGYRTFPIAEREPHFLIVEAGLHAQIDAAHCRPQAPAVGFPTAGDRLRPWRTPGGPAG